MELVVVAPRLLSLPASALQSSVALSRLASWATHTSIGQGRDAAMLNALQMNGASVAALIARGAGIDPGIDHWLVADPVTLVAGLDDVIVAARADGLDPAFVARIVDLLNSHFAADALILVAPHADRWLVRLAGAPQMTLVPTDVAMGGSLYAHRPQGRDARRFERYANEIQMLLHDLPENDARERAGSQPFNALWFWGGTMASASQPSTLRIDAFAAAGADGDLARGAALASGGVARDLGDRLMVPDRGTTIALVVLPALAHNEFAGFDAAWLAPAVAALECRTIARFTLIADGSGVHQWTASAPAFLLRLRARWLAQRFVVPS